MLQSNTVQSTATSRTTKTLILAAGSRAGTEAPLEIGYYMIGRHADCQIRPKSKSVSRRHCLVHCDANTVRVFDLDSTSGTFINGERIQTKTWVALADSDLLRLGKIGFRLRIDQIEHPPSDDSIVTGEAWDSFDVAEFLGAEDDADREMRYEKIRSQNKSASNSDVLDVVPQDPSGSSSGFITDVSDVESVDLSLTLVPIEESTSRKSAPSKSEMGKSQPKESRITKPKTSRHGTRFASWKSKVQQGDNDKRKLAFAAIFAVAVLSFAVFKAYQFSAGPPVRVLREID